MRDIRKLKIINTTYYYERRPDFWIVHLLHNPDFTYGTRLLLYDNARAVLEVLRPDGQDIVELTDEKRT